MLMMIQGHTIFELTKPELISSQNFPWNVWEFMRGLTAPVFLLVSGIVNVFANKRDENGRLPRKTINRRFRLALMLIFTGYFLVFPADKIFHLAFVHPSVWTPFLQVNVLQLIGITLLMVLLLFIITRNNRQTAYLSLLIATIIAVLNPFIHKISFFEFMPEFLASYFSMNHGSVFTIFPFSGFVFIGLAFGSFLIEAPAEKRLNLIFKWGLIIGFLLLASGIPLYYYINSLYFPYPDTLKANSGMMLIRAGSVFIILSLITIVYKKTENLGDLYSIFGKRALFVYITHLIIIYGLPWYNSFGQLLHEKLNLFLSIPIAILVQILSLSIAYYYDKSQKTYPTARYFYRYSFISIVIYLLFV